MPDKKPPAEKLSAKKLLDKKLLDEKPIERKLTAKKQPAKKQSATQDPAKQPSAKKPKNTAFTVAVSAADDGTSAPALRVYVAMASDPLSAVAAVQAMMPEAAVELSGTLSDRLAARLKLKPGEVRSI